MILFWVFVVILIIAFISHFHEETESDTIDKNQERNANLVIIKERYAKGEINKKEYEQLKKDLT
jgi:uncharacterized membrane protein